MRGRVQTQLVMTRLLLFVMVSAMVVAHAAQVEPEAGSPLSAAVESSQQKFTDLAVASPIDVLNKQAELSWRQQLADSSAMLDKAMGNVDAPQPSVLAQTTRAPATPAAKPVAVPKAPAPIVHVSVTPPVPMHDIAKPSMTARERELSARAENEQQTLFAALKQTDDANLRQQLHAERAHMQEKESRKQFLRQHKEMVNEEGQELFNRIVAAQDALESQEASIRREPNGDAKWEEKRRSEAATKAEWRAAFVAKWTPIVPVRFRQLNAIVTTDDDGRSRRAVPAGDKLSRVFPNTTDMKVQMGVNGLNRQFRDKFDKEVEADTAAQATRKNLEPVLGKSNVFYDPLTQAGKVAPEMWKKLAKLSEAKDKVDEEGAKFEYRRQDRICRDLQKRELKTISKTQRATVTTISEERRKMNHAIQEALRTLEDRWAGTQQIVSQLPNGQDELEAAKENYLSQRAAIVSRGEEEQETFERRKQDLEEDGKQLVDAAQARINKCFADMGALRVAADQKRRTLRPDADSLEAEWEQEKQQELEARKTLKEGMTSSSQQLAAEERQRDEVLLNQTRATVARLARMISHQTKAIKILEAHVDQTQKKAAAARHGFQEFKAAVNSTAAKERNAFKKWKAKRRALRIRTENATAPLREERKARKRRLRALIAMRQRRDETNRIMKVLKERLAQAKIRKTTKRVEIVGTKLREEYIKRKLVVMAKNREAEAAAATLASIEDVKKERLEAAFRREKESKTSATNILAMMAAHQAAVDAALAANSTNATIVNGTVVGGNSTNATNGTVVLPPNPLLNVSIPRIPEDQRVQLFGEEKKAKRMIQKYFSVLRMETVQRQIDESEKVARLEAEHELALAKKTLEAKKAESIRTAEKKNVAAKLSKAYQMQKVTDQAQRDLAVIRAKLAQWRLAQMPPLSILARMPRTPSRRTAEQNASLVAAQAAQKEISAATVVKPKVSVLDELQGKLNRIKTETQEKLEEAMAASGSSGSANATSVQEIKAAVVAVERQISDCAIMVKRNDTEYRSEEAFHFVNVTVYDYEPLKTDAAVKICKPEQVCKKSCIGYGWSKKCWNTCSDGSEICETTMRPNWVTVQSKEPVKTYRLRMSDGVKYRKVTVTRLVPKCTLGTSVDATPARE